jgi:UDP-N-acetylglucosamine 2-epimerase (non-hydrolysing)
MKVCIILGTRPEIIKLSSIIRYLKDGKKSFFIIHSNQHYSENMDAIFFKELNLPKPKYNLNVGSGSHGVQTAKMMEKIESILLKEKPSTVIVQGDTNTVLAGALVASKMQIPVSHVEAGLRSYDRTMPEELNRIMTDHISEFLFVPTSDQKETLQGEAIDKNKVFVVGNTVVDAVKENSKIAEKVKTLEQNKLHRFEYFLLTMHRPSNVDDKTVLKRILSALEKVSKQYGLKIVFPIHPRTANQIKLFKIKVPKGIMIIEPVGYLEFLKLQKYAKLIITDSGGIQEEACALKTPCVTIRENTERPETVAVGGNTLAGTSEAKIINSVKKMIGKKKNWKNPYGNGKTGEKIIKILERKLK